MYGGIVGVSSTGTGAATLAVLPNTGGLRPILLVMSVVSILIGITLVSIATSVYVRGRLAKSRA